MFPVLWLAVAVVLFVCLRLVRRFVARARDARSLPKELRRATLQFAERTFEVWRPLKLTARVDRAYSMAGKIHLLEFKTRAFNRVYRSDRIELSVQRLAVEKCTGEMVSATGYVVIQAPLGRQRTVRTVRLLEQDAVLSLMRRREAILDGRILPQYAKTDALCRECGFRHACRPDLLPLRRSGRSSG
jgi:hypothetical protein